MHDLPTPELPIIKIFSSRSLSMSSSTFRVCYTAFNLYLEHLPIYPITVLKAILPAMHLRCFSWVGDNGLIRQTITIISSTYNLVASLTELCQGESGIRGECN